MAVAKAIMGITPAERFLAVAGKRLAHLFPPLPKRPGHYKRRERLSDTIEALTAAPEREVCLKLLARLDRDHPVTVVGDNGYAGYEFEHAASHLQATVIRPRRRDEAGSGPHLAPIRQRVESIFHTCKDLLTLERHGARTLHGLRTRICQRFLALAAAISLNHRLGRRARALVDYTA